MKSDSTKSHRTGTCVVTGGAGFVGCAISPGLRQRFERVIAVDVLHPQIHPERRRPDTLDANVELVIGDIADPAVWRALLQDVAPDIIVHLAAETGTGQSLTESTRHAYANVTGTATMLDALAHAGRIPNQFLFTGSRAVYGEGHWRPVKGGPATYPGQRTREQLAARIWDFPGLEVTPTAAATTEPHPVSVYGATKLAQEHILSAWASAFGVKVKTLRLQNVYGPGQALANSYTGIVTLFCQIARRGEAIPLYEDGQMLRDFILIDDVSDAILAALDHPGATGRTLDIGAGAATPMCELASIIARHYGAPPPFVCGKYRFGDVRHAVCDVTATAEVLNWSARHDLATGIQKLADWIETQLL
jgi:dTDP-L-rhamnose 4-epimerase